MKIVIVKTSAIGDVLQTFPVLEYLRARFPEAQIDWVAERMCAELLSAHPLLDHLLVIETKKWRKNLARYWAEIAAFKKRLQCTRYDLVIDLQGNTKSALITLWTDAEEKIGFSWKNAPEKPNVLATTKRYSPPLDLSSRARNLFVVQEHFGDAEPFESRPVHLKHDPSPRLQEIVAKLKPARFMICPGSKWKNKQLPEETWKALLQKMHAHTACSFVFIWSSIEEKCQAERLHALFPENSLAVGDLSLNLWQALMLEMHGVIACDSAALHLAATSGTATFSIFGPSQATFYNPPGKRHAAFQGSCPYGRTFSKRCPILRTCATGACMSSLTAEDIFDGLISWLEEIASLAKI